jgi:hypothetical protein
MARKALSRAKTELASNDLERVKYAALELRLAMEAVTYDRASAFKAEIPPDEYETWQPRKLMQVLHDIDPDIGMSATIAIGPQDEAALPEKMSVLGTDTVFTLNDLKTHYDAIGNGLHMPSLGQLENITAPDPKKLGKRCETVISLLDAVLASKVWNSTIGNFSVLEHCIRCKNPVRKRIPVGKSEVEATCFECKAQYIVIDDGPGKSLWKPKMTKISCLTKGCDHKKSLWPDEVRPGTNWKCEGCGEHWVIKLGVSRAPHATDE